MVKTNKNQTRLCLALLAMMSCCTLAAASNGSTRTIRLRQDDAQVRFESKIYELKNATAEVRIYPLGTNPVIGFHSTAFTETSS